MNSVSPMKATLPVAPGTTKVMQPGVWPGVCSALACSVPIRKVSPSSNRWSNWRPSGTNSGPASNSLPNTRCTSVMRRPMPTVPPTRSLIQCAADRWSAWMWVSRIHCTVAPSSATRASRRSAPALFVRPDGAS